MPIRCVTAVITWLYQQFSQVQVVAEGRRTKVIEEARAGAEATKLRGAASAAVVEAVGMIVNQ